MDLTSDKLYRADRIIIHIKTPLKSGLLQFVDKKSGEVLERFDLPGKSGTQTWAIHRSKQPIRSEAHQLRISGVPAGTALSFQAMGVRVDDLPVYKGYKHHLFSMSGKKAQY